MLQLDFRQFTHLGRLVLQQCGLEESLDEVLLLHCVEVVHVQLVPVVLDLVHVLVQHVDHRPLYSLQVDLHYFLPLHAEFVHLAGLQAAHVVIDLLQTALLRIH